MFGSNTLFVFHHPQDAKAFEEAKKPAPTYEAAQKEIAENSGLNKLTGGGKSKGKFNKGQTFPYTCIISIIMVDIVRFL